MASSKSNSILLLSSSQQLLTHGKKIVCIGRNYAEHARELGNAVPTQPFFFLKPTTSYIRSGQSIEIPPMCKDVHHEIELGVVIGGGSSNSCITGKDVPEDQAMSLVGGYVLALDLTDRNLQNDAKKAGKPWTMSKGFDTFCPISDSIVAASASSLHNHNSAAGSVGGVTPDSRLWCKVNGETRQDGSIADMIFPIPKLISYISSIMTLEENDVILTGTPAGVGPIQPGDVIEGGLDDILHLKFNVVAKEGSPSS